MGCAGVHSLYQSKHTCPPSLIDTVSLETLWRWVGIKNWPQSQIVQLAPNTFFVGVLDVSVALLSEQSACGLEVPKW